MRTRFTKQLIDTLISNYASDSAVRLRPVTCAQDMNRLIDAFADAYLDTPDYQGCTPRQVRADAEVEVEMTLAGQFGRWISEASLIVPAQESALAAVLVVEWHGSPWLRHLFVRRGYRRAGVASAMLTTAAQTLHQQGHRQISTFANAQNKSAVTFLAVHGFTANDFVYSRGKGN